VLRRSAFVLGDRLEAAFRQSLILAHGDRLIFVTRPISGCLLAIAVIVMIALGIRTDLGRRPVTPETRRHDITATRDKGAIECVPVASCSSSP
jgi:TctA family transporter